MHPRWLIAASAMALFTHSGCAAPTPPPNIVLIYVDDLGWRDLGVMGSEYYETPNIDALASQGIRFTQAYSNAPNCAPARASLLSGLYPPRHGVYTVGTAERGEAANRRLVPVDNLTDLSLATVTLAEALAGRGYATGHVGKWHLGGPGFEAAAQGFAWSVAGDASGAPPSYFHPYARNGRSLPDLDDGDDGEYLTDRLTDEALRFLDGHRDEPFFLYLSHYGVHTPIQAKAELEQYYRDKPPGTGHDNPTYAAMIQSVDESVGRLLRRLDERDLRDDTIVIFFSDNGGFGPATSMAPLRGSKGMLYEGGIRVPLSVRWPGTIRAGTVSDTPVIGVDLFPTLLAAAGIDPSGDPPLDGIDLTPLLTATGPIPDRPLFWHFPAYLEADASVPGPWRTTPAAAVRRGGYKLVTFFEDGRNELYDLTADLGETRDLADKDPERTAQLRALLESWWAETGAWIPTEPNPLYEAGSP
ncbi:MAG: sulfatase [Vicinamibacterales bacterium]|jgi:arylsulfatase A-like enzyme|nr:sulfatase [Vicinamibacterales bacterium]MDP6607967.1 sulfatase [Vicinamibacterales bacterium]|tara:strand:- start:5334 stop:6749 length:1416 start_codon:yes stop_codon:yes gene_type:complete